MDEGDDAGAPLREDLEHRREALLRRLRELHEGILAAAATGARKDGGNSRERVRTTEDEAGRLRQIELEAHELVEIEKHKRVAGEAAKKKLEREQSEVLAQRMEQTVMDRIEREKREDLAIEADRKRRKLEIELARKKEEHILHLHQIELEMRQRVERETRALVERETRQRVAQEVREQLAGEIERNRQAEFVAWQRNNLQRTIEREAREHLVRETRELVEVEIKERLEREFDDRLAKQLSEMLVLEAKRRKEKEREGQKAKEQGHARALKRIQRLVHRQALKNAWRQWTIFSGEVNEKRARCMLGGDLPGAVNCYENDSIIDRLPTGSIASGKATLREWNNRMDNLQQQLAVMSIASQTRVVDPTNSIARETKVLLKQSMLGATHNSARDQPRKGYVSAPKAKGENASEHVNQGFSMDRIA
eukprot:g4325.t1